MSAEIIEFASCEVATLNTGSIAILRDSLGEQRCREVLEEVVFHLADRLNLLQDALLQENTEEAAIQAARLAGLSEQIGLTDFARVARNLHDCCGTDDLIATNAVGMRLVRLGEDSLFSVMSYADQTAL